MQQQRTHLKYKFILFILTKIGKIFQPVERPNIMENILKSFYTATPAKYTEIDIKFDRQV